MTRILASNVWGSARGRWRRVLALALQVGLLAGCAGVPPAHGRSSVSAKLFERTGFELVESAPAGKVSLPSESCLTDRLTEDEAVVIALWNNAAFQEQLTDLGVARGDLVQAGLLPNPEAVYFFNTPGKAYKYLVDFPLEALWLRPIRVAAAARESARVSDRLTQGALDLIRDVRQACADMLLAKGRLRVAEDAVRLRGRVAELAAARFKAGDASEQEAATARIDALTARQDAVRIAHDVALAEVRLRNLLALGPNGSPLTLDDRPPPVRTDLDSGVLTAEATTSRPDALAAEELVAAAAERRRLSRLGWVRLLGLLDATSGQRTGHEFGPAFRVTLPVFNTNQGAIARADAELERAHRQRLTVRNQIILDVHQAYLRYAQAVAELEVLDRQVRPEVEASIRRAEAAYGEGNAPYVVVLEATRQLLDTHLRREQLFADLRRAWADLERSVGRRLASPAGTPGGAATTPGMNGGEAEAPAPPPQPGDPAP